MTELIGWLIVAALVFAVLRLIWSFIVLGIAAYVVIKIGKHLVSHHNKVIAARHAACEGLIANMPEPCATVTPRPSQTAPTKRTTTNTGQQKHQQLPTRPW